MTDSRQRGTEGLVVLPDGSTFDPGFVTFPDGTQAAEAERQYHSQMARSRLDERAMHAGERTSLPPNAEMKQEWDKQIAEYYSRPLPQYRSSMADKKSETEQLLYGRTVVLNAGQKVQGVWTQEHDEPRIWNVYLQMLPESDGLTPFNAQGYGHGDLSFVNASLQWMVGGVTFNRQIIVKSLAIQRFPVNARKVMIDLTAFKVGDPTLGGKTFQMNIGVASGYTHETDETAPLWVPAGDLVVPHGGFTTSQLLLPDPNSVPISIGYLMSAVVTLKTVPGGAAPWYPMFFNHNVAPVAGDFPLLVLPPLKAAGDVSTADDEFVTSWEFDIGLTCALSTTPDVYTPVGAGGVMRVDFKVGT
jgi:hypothetical protein